MVMGVGSDVKGRRVVRGRGLQKIVEHAVQGKGGDSEI